MEGNKKIHGERRKKQRQRETSEIKIFSEICFVSLSRGSIWIHGNGTIQIMKRNEYCYFLHRTDRSFLLKRTTIIRDNSLISIARYAVKLRYYIQYLCVYVCYVCFCVCVCRLFKNLYTRFIFLLLLILFFFIPFALYPARRSMGRSLTVQRKRSSFFFLFFFLLFSFLFIYIYRAGH